jgi:hypothetical protein
MRAETVSNLGENKAGRSPRNEAVSDLGASRGAVEAIDRGSSTAQRLDDVLALRDLVEQLQGVDLPQGFGRD